MFERISIIFHGLAFSLENDYSFFENTFFPYLILRRIKQNALRSNCI